MHGIQKRTSSIYGLYGAIQMLLLLLLLLLLLIVRFRHKFHHRYIVLLLSLQPFLPGIQADSRSDICRQGRRTEPHYDTAATGTHRRPGHSSCPRSQADIHSGVTDPHFGTSRH